MTRITNNELEKLRLNFSRRPNLDVDLSITRIKIVVSATRGRSTIVFVCSLCLLGLFGFTVWRVFVSKKQTYHRPRVQCENHIIIHPDNLWRRRGRVVQDASFEIWMSLAPPPYCYLDLFSVVPSSTPPLRCVNSHLVSLTI